MKFKDWDLCKDTLFKGQFQASIWQIIVHFTAMLLGSSAKNKPHWGNFFFAVVPNNTWLLLAFLWLVLTHYFEKMCQTLILFQRELKFSSALLMVVLNKVCLLLSHSGWSCCCLLLCSRLYAVTSMSPYILSSAFRARELPLPEGISFFQKKKATKSRKCNFNAFYIGSLLPTATAMVMANNIKRATK